MAGVAVTRYSSVLAFPSLDLSACNDLPKNSLVAQLLQEVQFGASSEEVRALLLAGNEKEAKRKLARMEAEVADHPWLPEKLAQLRELTERDAAMSAKELRYSGRSMSRRLTALDEWMFLMEETQRLDIPAYPRRKGADGRGRSKP